MSCPSPSGQVDGEPQRTLQPGDPGSVVRAHTGKSALKQVEAFFSLHCYFGPSCQTVELQLSPINRTTTWSASLRSAMLWRGGPRSRCVWGRRRFQRTSWSTSWSWASSPCPPPAWNRWSSSSIKCWINSSLSSCSPWSSLARLVREGCDIHGFQCRQ